MHCEHCGSPLRESDKFCSQCGTPVLRAQNNPIIQFDEDKEPEQDLEQDIEQDFVQEPVQTLEQEPVQEPVQTLEEVHVHGQTPAPAPHPKAKPAKKPAPRRMTLWERFLGGLIAALIAVILFLGAYWIFGKYANPPASGAASTGEGKYLHGLFQKSTEGYRL